MEVVLSWFYILMAQILLIACFQRPVGFMKWVFDMPNALAFLFIKSVKSFTFPETSSLKLKSQLLLELETVIWSSSLIVYVSPKI